MTNEAIAASLRLSLRHGGIALELAYAKPPNVRGETAVAAVGLSNSIASIALLLYASAGLAPASWWPAPNDTGIKEAPKLRRPEW